MEEFKIIRADVESLRDIALIEAEASRNPWPDEITESYLKSDNTAFFMAHIDGAPAGYLSLSYILDEGSILNVAVKPGFRRRGIAGALIKEAKRLASERKLAFLSLEVRESNSAAAALYESEGFRLLGKRPSYYEKPKEDALIMQYEVRE